jgi:hypothetical protein
LIEKTQEKLTQLKILQNKHSNKNKDCCWISLIYNLFFNYLNK